MVDWRTIKKVDAHIHILPYAVHEANPDSEDAWVLAADLHKYCGMMDALGIEKAVIMPFNDPWLMSMEFTVHAVHKNLYEIKQRYPEKFYAFADIDTRNTPAESVEAIHRAIMEYGLDGIKIHPNNTGVDLDSAYNQPIFAYAQEHKIPVAIHSYPNTADDRSATYRIANVLNKYPDLTVIVSHMGAYQWEQLLPTRAYVDISAILPDYVRTYGLAKTNEILRGFGADRLIFATDYPDSRCLQPEEIYASYLDILNQMDFTREEAEKIAYGNMEKLLKHRHISFGECKMNLQYGNLTIRDAVAADAAQLTAWWNDGAVMAHAGFPNGLGTTVEKVIAGLKKGRLVLEENGRLIGEACYRKVGNAVAEIGIKICETDCQNRGLGRIILSMLISWLFEQGFEKIVLDTNLSNLRAQHVYESLGFRKLGVNIDSWTDQLGNKQSAVDYELTEDNFIDYR